MSPFAPTPVKLSRWAWLRVVVQKLDESERKRLAARAYRGRSDAYRYIRANLPSLLAEGFGTRNGPSFRELAETVTRAGYKNRWGGALTGEAVRKIFGRAVADAANAPTPAAKGRPKNSGASKLETRSANSPGPGRSEQHGDTATLALPPYSFRTAPLNGAQNRQPELIPSQSQTGSDDLPPDVVAKLKALREESDAINKKKFPKF